MKVLVVLILHLRITVGSKYSITGYDCSNLNFIKNISTEKNENERFEAVNITKGHVQIIQQVHSSQVKKKT